MLRDSVRKGNTALNVLGFERSKSWSRKMLGMFNFGGGGCGDLFSKDELDDLFDSGDGVVSRDDPADVVEAADDIDTFAAPEEAPPAVNLCLT